MRDRLLMTSIVAAASVLFLAGASAAEAPLFTTEDGGRTFVYHSRPGDRPSSVAAMFGISPNGLPGFLAANGISDPTRVSSNFVYRIPNGAARELSDRVTALERVNARLPRPLGKAANRPDSLTQQAHPSSV